MHLGLQACSNQVYDGILDILPQDTASWHIESFKLKELEKNSRSKKVTVTFPAPPTTSVPSFSKTGHKSPRYEELGAKKSVQVNKQTLLN